MQVKANHLLRIDRDQVRELCEKLFDSIKMSAAAEELGMDISNLSRIKTDRIPQSVDVLLYYIEQTGNVEIPIKILNDMGYEVRRKEMSLNRLMSEFQNTMKIQYATMREMIEAMNDLSQRTNDNL